MANRAQDLADVATFTIGGGSGVKARVGPLQVAVIEHMDLAGLRCGTAFAGGESLLDNVEWYGILPRPAKANYSDFAVRDTFSTGKGRVLDVRGEDTLIHAPMYQKRWYTAFGVELFDPGPQTDAAKREKTIAARSPFPCWVVADRRPLHLAQIEVAGGLGFTLRLGLNLAEFADFLFGIAAVDLLGDDL